MNLPFTVLWTDHHDATIMRFGADESRTQKVHRHAHPTAQHGSDVRAEHEFFAEICSALEGAPRILVTAGHVALADFQRYAEKHRPATSARIIGYEVVDHLSENQLLALARTRFDQLERLASPSGEGS